MSQHQLDRSGHIPAKRFVAARREAACWTWDIDSRGSEGCGSGSLVPGDHPSSSVKNRNPECSPTDFHSREVNAEGDEMCMAALLWELIRLIKTRAVLAYCYTIAYWVIQKHVLILEKRWLSVFLLNKLIKGSGNRKGEGCCVSMWVANGTKVTSNVDGNSGRKNIKHAVVLWPFALLILTLNSFYWVKIFLKVKKITAFLGSRH